MMGSVASSAGNGGAGFFGRSRMLIGVVGLIVVMGGAIAVALLAGGGASFQAQTPDATHPSGTAIDSSAGMAPLPKSRPKLVEPVAGASTEAPTTDLPVEESADSRDPKISGPASTSGRADLPAAPAVRGLTANTATALPNGVALPPLEAPKAVLDVIQAGNVIARSPYKWGGGHGNFQDSGYDCSGSVTYALYSAGLISGSATSGALMGYGKPGPGKWISIYANPGHVYMMVAGVRFDTVARKLTGSRWQNSPVSAAGKYEVRHPPGY